MKQTWEYKVVQFAGRSENEQLNSLGTDGWELVNGHLFKHQLVLSEAPK